MRLNEPESDGAVSPLRFPCLLWEPTLDTIILATSLGTGTVLRVGHSRVLKVGMIIPYAASRWHYGDEEWDFILPPPRMKISLRNKMESDRWVNGLDDRIEVQPE